MIVKKLFIASDHAGFNLKEFLLTKLNHYDIEDLGAFSTAAVDYPDIAAKLSSMIKNQNEFGILICGSGIGISIAANRFSHIRTALCVNKEMALLARQHNDANVIALGARLTNNDDAYEMVKVFLGSEFANDRHSLRVKKLQNLS